MQAFEGPGESIEKLSQGLNNAFAYIGKLLVIVFRSASNQPDDH